MFASSVPSVQPPRQGPPGSSSRRARSFQSPWRPGGRRMGDAGADLAGDGRSSTSPEGCEPRCSRHDRRRSVRRRFARRPRMIEASQGLMGAPSGRSNSSARRAVSWARPSGLSPRRPEPVPGSRATRVLRRRSCWKRSSSPRARTGSTRPCRRIRRRRGLACSQRLETAPATRSAAPVPGLEGA